MRRVGFVRWAPAALMSLAAGALIIIGCGAAGEPSAAPLGPVDAGRGDAEMQMTVVYDNYPHAEGLETAWGFSCVVTVEGKTVLFDTGGDGRLLLANMRKLGMEPNEIDAVVLSHIHGDHTGGLEAFLRENHEVTVYVPASFPGSFIEQAKRTGAEVLTVEQAGELMPGVFTSGELGSAIREQSLVVATQAGLVVVTGCAHPGIVHIVEEVKKAIPGEIALAVGGFHLGGHSQRQIEEIVRRFQELDVRFAAPCHCSGDQARALFQQAYGDHYLEVGVGYRLSSEALVSGDD